MEDILIVEDDVHIQELLSICFDNEALRFSIASSGKGAIEIAKNIKPALILLDIMLPDTLSKLNANLTYIWLRLNLENDKFNLYFL